MPYLIDANNLAGKLGILSEVDWHENLLETLERLALEKNKKIVVVFDSIDPLGDKYELGLLTVVIAPRYANFTADDKILEIIEAHHNPEELTLVTDDYDLTQKARRLNCSIKSAEIMAKELLFDATIISNEKDLPAAETEQLNAELLKLWQ